MTERVQKIIKFFEEHDYDTCGGVFDTRNIAGDRMYNIYNEDNVQIDICYDWEYVEIFGLLDSEFNDVCIALDDMNGSWSSDEEEEENEKED